MLKKTLSVFGLLLFQSIVVLSFAVKAYPFPTVVIQPDGTQLTVFLQGDEFRHFRTTEDGYLIKKNKKGFYTYAGADKKGALIESGIVAKNPNKRSFSDRNFLKTINKAEALKSIDTTANAGSVLMKSKAASSKETTQKSFPLTGTQKSLVILVNFSDLSFVTPDPKTAFSNLLNQDGYNANGGTGSARDYFMSNSYGKFIPNFDVVGP